MDYRKGQYHLVHQGDNLENISQFYRVNPSEILAYNPGLNPQSLTPNSYLLIPGGSQMRDTAAEEAHLVQPLLTQLLPFWPKPQRDKVNEFIQKFGLPQEVGMGQVTWFNNGPWKRTTIHRHTVEHDSPTAHNDFVASTIDYKVPTHYFGMLADFDGSLYPDRTAGEVTAKCDLEEMNFMALNIMHDMVTGKKNVQQALDVAVEIEKAFRLHGEKPLYTQGLQFKLGVNTADPGPQVF